MQQPAKIKINQELHFFKIFILLSLVVIERSLIHDLHLHFSCLSANVRTSSSKFKHHHKMKDMKGRILRKLKKSISNPTRKPGFDFQTRTIQIQAFQTLTDQDFAIPEIACHNADSQVKLAPLITSRKEKTDDLEPNPDEIDASNLKMGSENHIKLQNEENPALISDFEDRCPPGGKDSLVLYTTSLRGIRKTFEDCNTIRFLLESFRVLYSERDVSMHMEYRDELWGILGGRVVPPRLFIRGRYIGGADEVVGLHEKGMLRNLLEGIPLSPSNIPCRGCAGMRFVLCLSCNGSKKVVPVEGQNNGIRMRCPDCNENGLVKCLVCGV